MGKLASKIVSIKLGFEERCIISILSVRVSSGISALLSQSKTCRQIACFGTLKSQITSVNCMTVNDCLAIYISHGKDPSGECTQCHCLYLQSKRLQISSYFIV